ncbi:BQ5605_C010g05983 [Microbotryum silenes-dioicae]|uniref:BQ5605_C010g05983 protein n=1 Tax=Microbotryum silenes-dioicae TaxID=796604 RepID=A0A2X0LQB0_9BASI|nr:BQ5605_C010g05983 [Microbotryum silenes-dioicae]
MPPEKPAPAPAAEASTSSNGPRIPAGTTMLPISKVHKIIKADKDVRLCSKEAIFLISKTTEYMLGKVTQQSYAQARSQKRAKTVKYQDLATVAQRPEFFYLSDVVPHTLPLNKALAIRQKMQEAAEGEGEEEIDPDTVLGGEKAEDDGGEHVPEDGEGESGAASSPNVVEEEEEEEGSEDGAGMDVDR